VAYEMGGLLGQHFGEVACVHVEVLPIDCRAGAEAAPVY
jgi:hypothetical protein